MHRPRLPRLRRRLPALLLFLAAGCEFEGPLSPRPEAPVEERLLGRWVTPDGWVKVTRYDAEHYVMVYNGTVYRAWHSRVAGQDFLTLRNLEGPAPRHHFLHWRRVSDRRIDVSFVREDLVPRHERDPEVLRRAVAAGWGQPDLLAPAVPFIRQD
ncbi:MAG: hypothetical protein ACO3G4_12885 [Opitutaceae bacterium]